MHLKINKEKLAGTQDLLLYAVPTSLMGKPSITSLVGKISPASLLGNPSTTSLVGMLVHTGLCIEFLKIALV